MKEKNQLVHFIDSKDISRRNFLKVVGVFALGTGFISCVDPSSPYPPSQGYILVDTKKCQGCMTCMLACSLVQEGYICQSLSRIQILQNPFTGWPHDISIEQCRHCINPACVETCPLGALHVDTERGNIRLVDRDKCIGCQRCIKACQYEPKRPIVIQDENYGNTLKARKCDLCINAPFHWDASGGGIHGKLACVESCPVNAIAFTYWPPFQEGESGYNVNLRRRAWGKLGYPVY